MLNEERKTIEQNIHVINAKKCHLGSCTLCQGERQSEFLLKTAILKLGVVVVLREKTRNKKNQPKKGVGRCGRMRKGGINPHPVPSAIWDRGSQKDRLV